MRSTRVEKTSANLIEAAARGATEGMSLAIIAAMLIAFVGLVAMANWILGLLPFSVGGDPLSLEIMLGWIFSHRMGSKFPGPRLRPSACS